MTSPRFGQYVPMRTIVARYNEDKLKHTVSLGLSRPNSRLEPNESDLVMELRTYWDNGRQTLVTQALAPNHLQKLWGERYMDAEGHLKQTLDPSLPRPTQMRLQQDMQSQETEHYQWVNAPSLVAPARSLWQSLRRRLAAVY